MNQSLITALILCWTSVSGSESLTETVEGRPGKEVTLTCSKSSNTDSPTFWFRVFNRTKASCISSQVSSKSKTRYCDGYKNGRYNMSSNISATTLRINEVDVSDSGLYFCGYSGGGFYTFSAVHLNVKGSDDSHDDADRKSEKSDGRVTLMSLVLGALTGLLLMIIIGLVVKNRKLQKAANEEQNPQQPENLDSDLKDAALSVYAATIRNRRPASEREVETHVVYAVRR
ncbi:uncharacterized protein LOC117934846 isoform X2 [Etheostoma cragini]|uniref:uncharacterized protein LOC117934846 isoform X2 n=1 Tax=Etheostoma cragini TaxID=417921 RepID=UPI00155E27DD|nr:uncharacterized protein LOC117934846 isoform X2 [Etheostoma cragini]